MKILLFYILLTLIPILNTFKCGNNIIKAPTIKTIKLTDSLKEIRKLTLEFHPISIYIDTEILISQYQQGIITENYYINIYKALNKTCTYLSKLINVDFTYSIQLQPSFFGTSDDEYILRNEVPFITNNSINTDLILIPKIYQIDKVDAAAFPIAIGSYNKRPIAGGILLGKHYDFNKKNSEKYLIMLLLHEITHILAFNNNLYEIFPSGINIIKRKINNEDRFLFQGKNVLKQAKRHFNCDSIEGIELENQGGIGSFGSHWEARVMLGDYMISTDYPEITISEITLALLEDSGWYTVNYYTGGLFRFGKGLGCSFLNSSCIRDDMSLFGREFCLNENEERCSSGNIDRGFCYIVKYDNIPENYQYFKNNKKGGFLPSDYCPVSISYPHQNYYFYSRCDSNGDNYNNLPLHYGEIYGKNSICVLSSLLPKNYENLNKKEARCHKIECDYFNKSFTIDIGDFLLNCSGKYEEVNVDNYSGSIICPDYNRVCTGSVWCNDPLECIDLESYYDMSNDTSVNEVIGKKNICQWVYFSFWIFGFFILMF